MLFLALSCLPGEKLSKAFRDLATLAPGVVGIQLTPGCVQDTVSVSSCLDYPVEMRSHHGFNFRRDHGRDNVWDYRGKQIWVGDSMHPPLQKHVGLTWRPIEGCESVIETMYPGYAFLHDGPSIAEAMDREIRLAVDVAHIDIQRRLGLIDNATFHRLLTYDRIDEVHVSMSIGSKDSHRPAQPNDWGVAWARERLGNGVPTVIECVMTRMTRGERQAQIELLLGEL